MIIAGIDPGKSGAICKLKMGPENTVHIITVHLCPIVKVGKKREYDINMMRATLTGDFHDDGWRVDQVWIEKVHSMPKQGVASMFSFGRGFGIWEGLAAGLFMPISQVAPQTWRKYWLQDMPKEKGSAVVRVKQLFPSDGIYFDGGAKAAREALAEATLIAMYGARVRR